MKDQLKATRAALERAHDDSLDDKHIECRDTLRIQIAALAQLEAMAGEPVAWQRRMRPTWGNSKAPWGPWGPWGPWEECSEGQAKDYWRTPMLHDWAYEARALYTAAPVAQQPQEIEVQCPVCNHKFYEWPNDKQPQAEAVPVVDRVYEAAKRLVDHADFQLGGVLSAKSKARDIPSNAASKVKARHLASLRDALAKTPQQAEAVPANFVLVPVAVLKAASESLGSFVSDQGQTTLDMQAMDNIDAILAQQKGQP